MRFALHRRCLRPPAAFERAGNCLRGFFLIENVRYGNNLALKVSCEPDSLDDVNGLGFRLRASHERRVTCSLAALVPFQVPAQPHPADPALDLAMFHVRLVHVLEELGSEGETPAALEHGRSTIPAGRRYFRLRVYHAASEQRANNLTGFEDFSMKDKVRIWP